MNHNIFSFLKHIFIRENVVFNNLAIVFRDEINKLLATDMIKRIWHLIRVNPIFTKLLSFLFNFMRNTFGFNLFEDDIVFHDLFIFEENTLYLMKWMLIDLKLLRNWRFLLNLIDIFLNDKFHWSLTFFLMFFFFFL